MAETDAGAKHEGKAGTKGGPWCWPSGGKVQRKGPCSNHQKGSPSPKARQGKRRASALGLCLGYGAQGYAWGTVPGWGPRVSRGCEQGWS